MSSGYLDNNSTAESTGWISTANDTLPTPGEDFVNNLDLKGEPSEKKIEEKEKAELGSSRRGTVGK